MKVLLFAALAAGVFADFGNYYDKFLDSDKQMSKKQGQRRVQKGFGGRKVNFDDWKTAFPANSGAYEVIDRDDDGVIWFQELMAYSKYNAGNPHAHHIAQPPQSVSDDDHEIIVENMLRQANPNGLPYATTQQFADWRARQTFDSFDQDKNGHVSPMEISTRLFDRDTVDKLRDMRKNPAAQHNASPEEVHQHPFDRVCRRQDGPVHPAPWKQDAMEAPEHGREHEWHHDGERRAHDGERHHDWNGGRRPRRLAAGTAVETGCNMMSDGQEHWCNAAGAVVDCTTGNWVGCGSGVWDAAQDIWDRWG